MSENRLEDAMKGIGQGVFLVLFLVMPATLATPGGVTVENGIVNRQSNHSVDATLQRLKESLVAKGITLFAVIDHSGEAEKVGLKMLPTKLLVFGNPRAGTPLM